MQLHYLRPGLAWLNHNLGWYLIESDLGVVRDEHVAMAMHLITRIEDHHGIWQQEDLGDVRDFSLFVRKLDVLIPGDDVESAVHVYCDLLIEDDDPDVAARLTPLAHDVLTQAMTDTLRNTIVTYDLQVHSSETITGPADGPHPRGDHWFARFFGPGFPWADNSGESTDA